MKKKKMEVEQEEFFCYLFQVIQSILNEAQKGLFIQKPRVPFPTAESIPKPWGQVWNLAN